MPDVRLAAEYKKRAEEARREAERIADPTIKEGFMKVAKEYERMAEAALRNPF